MKATIRLIFFDFFPYLFIGCARKEIANNGMDTPTTTYTKSYELHYPGKGASSYTDWKCTVEVPSQNYKAVFGPTRNSGIDQGVRVDFTMNLPRYEDTEYLFTTTYILDGEPITRSDKTIIIGNRK